MIGNLDKNNKKNVIKLVIRVFALIAGLMVLIANYITTNDDYNEVYIHYATVTPTWETKPNATYTIYPNGTNVPVSTQAPAITKEPVITSTPNGSKSPNTMTPQKTQSPEKTVNPNTSKEPIKTIAPQITKEPVKTPEVPTKKPELKTDIKSSMKESTEKSVTNAFTVKTKLNATYENVSYYFYGKKCDEAFVFYKEKGKDYWKLADKPVYSDSDRVYKGSICYLSEGRVYDVKIEYYNNHKLVARQKDKVTTKNSNVKIAKTIKLSDCIKKDSIYGLYLKGIKGSKDGYIRIIGDINMVREIYSLYFF